MSQSECEEEWHGFGDKCFKYHNDLAGANFHDAMDICEYSYRATLVTIHSQQEFDFISDLIFDRLHAKYSVWIGLIRVSNESFIWFDRSSLDYTNWGPNEPNNWHSKNYCAVMSSASSARGKWFDVGCTTTYLVMCQKYLTKTANPSKTSENDLESNKSIADQINMQLEIEDNIQQLSLYEDLQSVKTLGNVNIVLTIILFLVIIGSLLKYKFNFQFIRPYRRNSQFSSFGNTLDRNSPEV